MAEVKWWEAAAARQLEVDDVLGSSKAVVRKSMGSISGNKGGSAHKHNTLLSLPWHLQTCLSDSMTC